MPASGTRFAFCYGLMREFHIASEATLRNKGECITWNHYEPRAYFMGYILYMYTCIPRMCPANERRRYSLTPSLIGWLHTQIEPLHFQSFRMPWLYYLNDQKQMGNNSLHFIVLQMFSSYFRQSAERSPKTVDLIQRTVQKVK